MRAQREIDHRAQASTTVEVINRSNANPQPRARRTLSGARYRNNTPAQTRKGIRCAQMPRYRFAIRDSDHFDDEDGMILPDLMART